MVGSGSDTFMAETSADIPKVLVTGGTGYIGSALVELLKSRGYCVRVYSRKTYGPKFESLTSKQNWTTGDLGNQENLLSACEGVEFVFHLAGVADASNMDAYDVHQANLMGTKNVLSACIKADVKKVLFMSSVHARYPETSHYAQSKSLAEELLNTLDRAIRPLQVIILRPPSVYGPGMKGNLSTFIRIASRCPMPSLRNLARTFPLISVGDLCRAAADIVESDLVAAPTSIYELSDGQEYTVDRIEKTIYRGLGRSQPRWKLPKWIYYLASSVAQFANNTGIKKNQLGFNLYRNLNCQPQTSEPPSVPSYEFTPADTLESEMPAIITSLNNQK